MKQLAIIFSVLMLLLSVISVTPVSGIEQTGMKKHRCCKSKSSKSDNSTKSCCKGICNPFMPCCGFYHQDKVVEIKPQFEYIEKLSFFSKNENHDFEFCSQNWHPPQFLA